MYNTDLPRRADLPTSGQLKRSTLIAAAAAAALLVTVVMPSEYGIDPTGAGRVLGLTAMGEIKTQLAAESAADAASSAAPAALAPVPPSADLLARMERMERLLVAMNVRQTAALASDPEATGATAPAGQDPLEALAASAEEEPLIQEAEAPAEAVQEPVAPEPAVEQVALDIGGRQDEMSFTLDPGQGAEIKMAMEEGATAAFSWSVDGGVVNYDTHGDGGGQNISYEKGRGVPAQDGEITAAFTGNHGWFWRNRGKTSVSITLRTSGVYSSIDRKV